MLRTRGVGGVGWDVNVHVSLRQQLMLRTRGVGWDVNVHVNFMIIETSYLQLL